MNELLYLIYSHFCLWVNLGLSKATFPDARHRITEGTEASRIWIEARGTGHLRAGEHTYGVALVGLAFEDSPGLTAAHYERGSSVVVLQLGRVALYNLLPGTEVLGEVESQPVLLPVISGTNKSETGGSIVKSNWKT